MTSHDFVLRFALPDPGANPAHFLDALFEAGCDDAVIGIGLAGSVALDFSREAASADVAVRSAIEAVMTAIPDAELTEVPGWFRDAKARRMAINNVDRGDGHHRSEWFHDTT